MENAELDTLEQSEDTMKGRFLTFDLEKEV